MEGFSRCVQLKYEFFSFSFNFYLKEFVVMCIHSKKCLGRQQKNSEVRNGKLQFSCFIPSFGQILTNFTCFRPNFGSIWTNFTYFRQKFVLIGPKVDLGIFLSAPQNFFLSTIFSVLQKNILYSLFFILSIKLYRSPMFYK